MGTSQIIKLAANFKMAATARLVKLFSRKRRQVCQIKQQTGSSRRPRQAQGISILFRSTYVPSLVLDYPSSLFSGL